MSFKMALRIWVIVFALAASGSALKLDITRNVGGSVKLNCTTEGEDASASQTSVLRISRNDGKVIGRVDRDQDITKADVKDPNVQIGGHIAAAYEVSYLEVTIANPTCKDFGTYTCIEVASDLSSSETKETLTVDNCVSASQELMINKLREGVRADVDSLLQLAEKSIQNNIQKQLDVLDDKVSTINYRVAEIRKFKEDQLDHYQYSSKAIYGTNTRFAVNPHKQVVVHGYSPFYVPVRWMNTRTGIYTTPIAGLYKIEVSKSDDGVSKWYLCKDGRYQKEQELVNWRKEARNLKVTEYWMLDEGVGVWIKVKSDDKIETVRSLTFSVKMID